MILPPPPEGLCGALGCVFLTGHEGPHTWDTAHSPGPVAEDPHPLAPRVTMLIRSDQLEAVKTSAAREGFHTHELGKPAPAVGVPEMPDAGEGETWITVCGGPASR